MATRAIRTLTGMALSDLVALNRKSPDAAPDALLPDACAVKTCLREVRIAALPEEARPAPMEARAAGFETYSGAEAYRGHLRASIDRAVIRKPVREQTAD